MNRRHWHGFKAQATLKSLANFLHITTKLETTTLVDYFRSLLKNWRFEVVRLICGEQSEKVRKVSLFLEIGIFLFLRIYMYKQQTQLTRYCVCVWSVVNKKSRTSTNVRSHALLFRYIRDWSSKRKGLAADLLVKHTRSSAAVGGVERTQWAEWMNGNAVYVVDTIHWVFSPLCRAFDEWQPSSGRTACAVWLSVIDYCGGWYGRYMPKGNGRIRHVVHTVNTAITMHTVHTVHTIHTVHRPVCNLAFTCPIYVCLSDLTVSGDGGSMKWRSFSWCTYESNIRACMLIGIAHFHLRKPDTYIYRCRVGN